MLARYRVPNAPTWPGAESNMGYFGEDGSKKSIDIKEGVYEHRIGDDPDFAKTDRELTTAGLVRMTDKAEDGDEDPKAPTPSAPPKKLKTTIRLAHPDSTPDNRITADVPIEIEGEAEPVTVKLKEGLAQSRDLRVIRALEARGYIIQNPLDLEKEIKSLEEAKE